ncbi:hypothetical protein MASR2M47_28430 [Draconibacterium sp.]
MFILTSYVMHYHDRFNHDSNTATEVLSTASSIASEEEMLKWIEKHDIKGRLVRDYLNPAGNRVFDYADAGGSTRVTFISANNQVVVDKTTRSKADAITGIHRQHGYGGGLTYNLYAFHLDILGVSLILFTITGVIMWIRLLKKDKWTWIIFFGGLAYFGSVLLYLTFS